MSTSTFLIVLFAIQFIDTGKIPFIRDAIIVPRNEYNNYTVVNGTCEQCLCASMKSFIALNCLPNETCQLFSTFPLNYKILPVTNARTYFPQEIYPNQSECCLPNTTGLLNKLGTAIAIHANVSTPRSLTIDSHGYLVTVSITNRNIVRLYSANMSIVNHLASPIFSAIPYSITYFNGAYYIGFDKFILAIDSNNLTLIHNFTNAILNGVRDIRFLNSGQTMIATSVFNNLIVFFNLTHMKSQQYSVTSIQLISFTGPQRLLTINDTCFYVTSQGTNKVYSISLVNSTFWLENLFLDESKLGLSADGNNLFLDECNRFWYALGLYGIQLYSSDGKLIGNLTQVTSFAFQTLITNNYVIYISQFSANKITRIDMNMEC